MALLAVGAYGGWWWGSRDSTAAAAVSERTQLVAASLGTVKQTVAASGTLEPATISTATFSSTGTVTAVDVTVGEHVTKGQTLATLDSSALQDAVTLATASVTAARDQVDAASGAQSLASARAQLATAESQLASAKDALGGATLTAPITGTVSSVGVSVGDTVGSGSSAGGPSGAGGQTSGQGNGSSSTSGGGIQIVDTSTWVVDATVGSSDLGRLKKGLQATITPTGGSQNIFGTVSSVGIVAAASPSGAAQFPVLIAVTGTPDGLHAGTTATVAITVRQLTDVLTVPTAAVRTTDGRTTVQVSSGGHVSDVPVTVGGVYGTRTVISEGLTEGEEVVVTTRAFARSPGGSSSGIGNRRSGFGGGGFGGAGFGGGGGGFGGPPSGGGAP